MELVFDVRTTDRIFVYCPYTVLQTLERPGVCSAVYGTVHNKEPLKLSAVIQKDDLTLVLIQSRYCHDCAKSDIKQYPLTVSFN